MNTEPKLTRSLKFWMPLAATLMDGPEHEAARRINEMSEEHGLPPKGTKVDVEIIADRYGYNVRADFDLAKENQDEHSD